MINTQGGPSSQFQGPYVEQAAPGTVNPGGRKRNRKRNRGNQNDGGGKRKNMGRRSSLLGPIAGPDIRKLLNQLLAPDRDALNQSVQAQQEMGKLVAAEYGKVAPVVQGAYSDAAQTQLAAGQGFSSDLQGTLEGQNADIQGFLDKVGAGGFAAPDAGAAADSLYGTGGYIPGTALTREGAAQTGAAAMLPATQLNQAALNAQMLRRQGMADIQKTKSELLPQLMQLAISEQAQNLYEKEFGETKRQNQRDFKLQVAGLRLEAQKEARYLQQQIDDGLRIDSAASNVLGYVVDHNGNPVLKDGHKIKVAGSASSKTRKENYQNAVDKASDLRGDPMANPNVGPASPGQYLAAPGAKGVFPGKGGFPATTNNPSKARWDSKMSFHEALRFLHNRYGIPRKRARAALVAAGWVVPAGYNTGPPGHVGDGTSTHN